MGMHRKAGEAVSIEYQGQPAAAGVAVLLYDANQNPRTLGSFERIVIDTLQFDTQAVDSTNLVYVVTGTTVPTAVPTDTGQIVASFSAQSGLGAQGTVFPGEGLACPVGSNLYLLLVGNAWNGVFVSLNGQARVVNGKSQGSQAGYKALLTPGGNIGGN